MGMLTILKKVKQEERNVRILVLGLDNAGKSSIVKRLCGHTNIDDVEPTLGFRIETLDYRYGIDDSNSTTTASSSCSSRSSSGRRNERSKDDASGGEDVRDATSNSGDNSHGHGHHGHHGERNNNINSNDVLRLHLWDIGGQSSIRAYWRNYFEQTDGLIWVVDSSDTMRLDLVAHELAKTLQQEKLEGATLLVFANKIDLVSSVVAGNDDENDGSSGGGDHENDDINNADEKLQQQKQQQQQQQDHIREQTATATAAADAGQVATTLVTSRLQLDSLVQYENRHWNVVPCSALTGDGLQHGIDWLVHDIQSRLSYC